MYYIVYSADPRGKASCAIAPTPETNGVASRKATMSKKIISKQKVIITLINYR